jgi:hydrogenase maturation protein HypF
MNLLGHSRHGSERRQKAAHRPALRWLISGVVPGVGFRAFVYQLARAYGLKGWVRNYLGQVEIVAAGTTDQLQAFEREFMQRARAIAYPRISRRDPLDGVTLKDFRILASRTGQASDKQLPPDRFI